MTTTNGHAEAFAEMAQGWQNLMMDNWSTWTKATVGSEAFSQTSASMMDWSLASQKQMQDITGQYLDALDLPRRDDLARLSDQVLAVEKRLVEGEDERDELKEQLRSVESKLDQVLSLLQKAQPVAAKPAAKVAAKPAAKNKRVSKSKTKAKTSKSSK